MIPTTAILEKFLITLTTKGVMNGPSKYRSARKFLQVLACSVLSGVTF